MQNNADVPRSFVHPQSNLVVQSTTTPGHFDMWKNAAVPSSDIPPNQPSGTEHYYTQSVWHEEECRYTKVRCTSSHILAPHVCKCYKDFFHSTPIHSYPSTCSLLYDYTKVLLSRYYFHFLLNLQFFGSGWHSVRHSLTGKKCLKRLANLHICFWVFQTQCTMWELWVTSTFSVIMVFLDVSQEGIGIGFWNMV